MEKQTKRRWIWLMSLPSKRTGSWKSMATLRRRVSTSRSRISRPSRKTVPEGGSQRRLKALKRVDLPLPLGPMIPTIIPLGISTLIPFSICFCSPPPPPSATFVKPRISNLIPWSPFASASTVRRWSWASSAGWTEHKSQNLNFRCIINK